MAGEIILVEYRHEVESARKNIQSLIGSIDAADNSQKALNNEIKKMPTPPKTTSQAYKEQEGVINKLRFSISALTTARDKSNNPALLQRYNKLIDEQNAKLKSLTSTQNQSAAAQNKINLSVQKTGSGFQSAIGTATSGFQSLSGALGQIGPALGIAFGVEKIISFGKESINAASDFNEEFAKSGEVFGDAQKSVVDFAEKGAQALGQSKTEVLQGAANFGIFARSAGLGGEAAAKFSTDFVALASDLASFNNSTPEEATLAIGAALRGEAEPIRRFGVLLDDATLRNEALKLGLISTTKEALTPQQKVLAAQAAIYAQTAVAQGDFARNSEGLANQQRILAAEYENLQITLGTGLLPLVLDLTSALNKLFQGDIKGAIDSLGNFYDKLDPLALSPMTNLLELIEDVQGAFSAFSDGDYGAAFQKVFESILDGMSLVIPGFGVIRTGIEEIAESLGIFSTEISKSQQELDRFVSKQSVVDKAIAEGGENLDKVFERVRQVTGATREEFDRYVQQKSKQVQVEKEAAPPIEKQLTLMQLLTKQVQDLTSSIQNKLAAGGVVSQDEVKRLIELEERIKSVASQFNRLKDQQNRPNLASAITLDTEGFDLGKEKGLKSLNQFYDAAENLRAREEFGLRSETELMAAEYENRLAIIQDYERRGVFTHEEAVNAKSKIDQDFFIQSTEKQLSQAQLVVDSISQLGDIVNGIYQIQINSIEKKKNDEIEAIQSSTLSEEQKNRKIDEINKKSAQKQYELQVKQFKVSQGIQIANAIIQGAQAALAAFTAGASLGPAGIVAGPAFAAVAAALAAVQIGVIASQPPPPAPSFFKGTEFVQLGNNKKGRDTIPSYLNEGEAVIPTSENARYPGMAKAWIGGKLPEYMQKNFIEPQIAEYEKKMAAKNREQMAEAIAVNMLGSKFNDSRLFGVAASGNKILAEIATNTRTERRKKRTVN